MTIRANRPYGGQDGEDQNKQRTQASAWAAENGEKWAQNALFDTPATEAEINADYAKYDAMKAVEKIGPTNGPDRPTQARDPRVEEYRRDEHVSDYGGFRS